MFFHLIIEKFSQVKVWEFVESSNHNFKAVWYCRSLVDFQFTKFTQRKIQDTIFWNCI